MVHGINNYGYWNIPVCKLFPWFNSYRTNSPETQTYENQEWAFLLFCHKPLFLSQWCCCSVAGSTGLSQLMAALPHLTLIYTRSIIHQIPTPPERMLVVQKRYGTQIVLNRKHFRYKIFNCVLGLTYCGLVTPCGNIDPGLQWLKKWLVAWWHQTITWMLRFWNWAIIWIELMMAEFFETKWYQQASKNLPFKRAFHNFS